MDERTAIVFCMGRELLEGTVLDRNANFLASNLTEAGFRVRTIQVLDEIESEAVAAFQHAISLQPTFVVVTGGMGPGIDDITRDCLAKAAGVPLEVHAEAREFLSASYRRLVARGVVPDADLTDERLKMATLPKGAKSFENPIGTAPGVQLDLPQTTFFLLPGQPEEMRHLFSAAVAPVLSARGPEGHRITAHIDYPGGDESVMSRMLADVCRRHHGIQCRARLQGVGSELRLRITMSAEGADREAVQSRLDAATADLRARLGLEVAGGSAAGGERGPYLE